MPNCSFSAAIVTSAALRAPTASTAAALGSTALQFLAMTIDDAADRQRIAKDIATVTRLPAGASQEVRAFYEVTPYPRWHQFARPPTADRSFDEIIAADAAYLLPGSQPVGEPTEVLVAGCGTGSAIVPSVELPRRPHHRLRSEPDKPRLCPAAADRAGP